ncbi:hypothetical protein FSB08_32580 [Paraburkholderia sp. JPY432]|uniref:hypothetical protein n=1 Tax=Paraburkholderia TaxID=1822464 RepID=UPI0015954845|nr:hypothetical protein [Paraburkholderia youngii]NVH77127.1 hypothetical protein [Paraburkholderia youngii]
METIQRVSILVAEISNAGAQQSVGVGQVGETVSQMDETTQQNVARVDERASAAESLRQQAANLVDCVAQIRF